MRSLFILLMCNVVFISSSNICKSQDYIPSTVDNFYCPVLETAGGCWVRFPYFPSNNVTLKALVVFCNYPDEFFDPPGTVYCQYWPGSNHLEKPRWADNVICPTSTSVWENSLTDYFQTASQGRFNLIGDVYPELYVFEHNREYYKNNGGYIGMAVKELLENIDESVDFSEYDNLDPEDCDNDSNREEPDGRVDFIFIMTRFNNGGYIEGTSDYTGVAALGGKKQLFGPNLNQITLDGVVIDSRYPKCGAISDMRSPWELGIPIHEFGEHYFWGSEHSINMGAFNINGGGMPSARDRGHMQWDNTGPIYVSSDATVTLRDYVTTGDYVKIIRHGPPMYIENRRRVSYYSRNEYHTWKWLSSENVRPQQPDSGLCIYEYLGTVGFGDRDHRFQSAYGRQNWDLCPTGKYKASYISNTSNFFYPFSSNRYTGESTFQLYDKPALDLYCNTLLDPLNLPREKVTYSGIGGDSNTCYDIGFNDVLSPWSNPPIYTANENDSLTIELVSRESNGSLVVNFYFDEMIDAKPSKPQDLSITQDWIGSTETLFHPRLGWSANIEPDHQLYKVYRGAIVYPGVDPTYTYIGSTQNQYFVDEAVTLYAAQGGSGICTYQYKAFSYRITAVDLTSKESVRSERDTIWGYTDPCAPEERPFGNLLNDELEYGLSQNYPNPFNPETIIRFSLNELSYVRLKVYNVLGQEIETLVSDIRDKGVYLVSFNARNRNLSSGVYYYKLEIHNNNREVFTSIKRMILIK
jgi:M6 family metalloprotease-like protein